MKFAIIVTLTGDPPKLSKNRSERESVCEGCDASSVFNLITRAVDWITHVGWPYVVNNAKTPLNVENVRLGIPVASNHLRTQQTCVAHNYCTIPIYGEDHMTHSKLSRLLKRGAFTLVACAAISVLSAEQADAQYYSGGRGISIGSFGGGGGFNLSYGNFSPRYGYGGGRGFSNSYYRPSYYGRSSSYYRPSTRYYGNRGGYSRYYGGRGRY